MHLLRLVISPRRFERVASARWLFAAAASVAFLVGSMKPYLAFHAIAIALGVLVCTKIGRRYWAGPPSKTINA